MIACRSEDISLVLRLSLTQGFTLTLPYLEEQFPTKLCTKNDGSRVGIVGSVAKGERTE